MPKVFIPNAPRRRDRQTGEFRPLDYAVASAYGTLQQPIFDEKGIPFPLTRDVVRTAEEAMREYEDGDSIVAIGDPVGISLLCSIAARNNHGRYSVLRWHGGTRQYIKFDVDIR